MVLVKPDARRRITLTKEVAGMAEEFELIKIRDEVLLIPIPKDPLKIFEKEGKKLPKGTTIQEMKKRMAETALAEVMGEHGIRRR